MAQSIEGWRTANDMILVEPLKEDNTSAGGVELISKTVKRKPKLGIVRIVDDNSSLKVVSVGEVVMYPHGAGTEVMFNDLDGKDKMFEIVDFHDLQLYSTKQTS